MRELLKAAADLTWLVWLVGGVGFILGCIALALTARKSTWSLWVGLLTLGLAAVTASIAAMEFQHRRSFGDRYVQPIEGDKRWSRVRGDQRRQKAYLKARSVALAGAPVAGFPLLLGLIATWISFVQRRRTEKGSSQGQVLVGRLPEAPRQNAGGALLPGSFSVLCILGVGATGALALAPLPEPEIDLRDPLWEWLSAVEQVQQTNGKEGCKRLVSGLEGLAQRQSRLAASDLDFTPASTKYLEPEYPTAARICVDALIAKGTSIKEPDIRSAVLHSFDTGLCRLKPDAEQQKRIDEELAGLPPPRPEMCECWGEPRFKNPYFGCDWPE